MVFPQKNHGTSRTPHLPWAHHSSLHESKYQEVEHVGADQREALPGGHCGDFKWTCGEIMGKIMCVYTLW